ncbi:uncharacterized protein ACA1_346870 [Acanthamoeba castellanii str. Neff]|uniref:DH domain-containing protein n=1 Tax=Acanthamoeba castellanii (strain ATCC 30010 / Neff) TaxID=1257118 RepID=L8GHP2_ACACF|nr:uncharacterized protein ACA1_346870 [Acanthamoeba castellanii str. Neff]ELR12497.1 hypothetical protein ACA1_346870 [Acanthamoeba castellanii str. Neff]
MELLHRELLKNTASNHPDDAKITSALDKIQKVVASVNETKQWEEDMAAVARIKSQIKNVEVYSP